MDTTLNSYMPAYWRPVPRDTPFAPDVSTLNKCIMATWTAPGNPLPAYSPLKTYLLQLML